jgi:HlyD family secretion protein
MNKQRLTIVTASLLVLGLLGWALWPEPLQVETATLAQGDFVREIVEDAQTRVRERYTVAAPLAGHLLRPRLQAGDAVQAGQTVAEIWPASASLLDSRSQGEQAERVAAMQATLARAQANRARAQTAEQQALADLQRSQALAGQGFVSTTQQEAAQLAWRQRQQERAMAEQELAAAEHDLQRLRIGLQGPGRPGAGTVWHVNTPIAGRVLKMHRDSEGPVAAGAPLLDVAEPQQTEVVVELLTSDAASLPTQATARLSHWGGEPDLAARLRRIEPGAYTKVSALGVEEQRVKAIFDWTQAPPRTLGDGYKLEIRIAAQQAQGVTLAPVSAVFPMGTGHAVFVLDAGRARQHAVQLRGRNGQHAWLHTDLPPGTVVVAYPAATLRAGQRIQALKPGG